MPFNSISFVLFLLIFTILYYCFENSRVRNIFILGASYLFYAYSNIFNLIFLLTTTIITFLVTNRLKKTARKKLVFFFGTAFILIQLIFAKYSTILFSTTPSLFENQYLDFIILPIGISFYSLQAISLLADVQSGKYKGDISLNGISQFLSFFPQSLAGPIHRADQLIP